MADTIKEFILRVKKAGREDIYIGRRYGDFSRLHKRLRREIRGKVLPPLPRKNKANTHTGFLSFGGDDEDVSSVSSVSTMQDESHSSLKAIKNMGHRRSGSAMSNSAHDSPRQSGDLKRDTFVLYREDQRVSLRAFLRTFLQNPQIAESKAMEEFLAGPTTKLNEEELQDIERRKDMDAKRIKEQRQFYEIARQRAKELDVYMERFRRDIVESSMTSHPNRVDPSLLSQDGLSKLFGEIREKEKIEDLTVEYKKFAEWLRIEYDGDFITHPIESS